MPTIHAHGNWLRWEQVGEGFPVLLVHGADSDRTRAFVDTGWVRSLRSAGRRVLMVDCRGHGESEGEPGEASAEAVAEDLGELLRYLNARRIDLLGHGRGAAASVAFAARRPGRIRSLVLLDPDRETRAAERKLAEAGLATFVVEGGDPLREASARDAVLGFLSKLGPDR